MLLPPSSAPAGSVTAATRPPRAADTPTGRPRLGLVLAALSVAWFVVFLDSSIVNVSLPTIRRDLGLSDAQLTWVVDSYLVAFAGLLLLGGRLADVLPRRAVLVASLTVFVVASAACALAPGGWWLVLARAVQGIGAAFMVPAALSIVMVLFPQGRPRDRALGVLGGVSAAGAFSGVLLSGVLTDALGWPSVFLVNVPVGLLLVAGLLRSIPATPGGGGAVDLLGAGTVTLGVGALAFGVINGAHAGWTTVATGAGLVTGALSLAAFAVAERRVPVPLVPLDVLRGRRLALADAVMLLMGAVTVGVFFLLPQHQQDTLGMSPTATSLSQLPLAAAISVSALVTSRLVARIGASTTLSAGLALVVAGLLWLSASAPGDAYLSGLVGPFLLIGAGAGAGLVCVTTLAVQGTPDSRAGLVSGLVNTARQVGGVLGLAALVAVASATGGSPSGAGLPDFSAAFLTAASLAGVALLLSLLPGLRR